MFYKVWQELDTGSVMALPGTLHRNEAGITGW